jgi:glycosyltransferase involved in cell wall biosynthesis
MQIYYIIHYFPPELNGGATRASELAKLWSMAGHQVTILTGFPNHPNGVIPEGYRGKWFMEESVDGYQVRRTFVYATPNKGSFKRILNHISLAISSVLGSLFKARPDVIIASSPPLFLGISGYILSKLKRVPYIFEVRDIWPQQAVDLEMLRNRHVIRAMEALEFFLYKHAAKVVGVAQSTKLELTERGLEPEKIEIVFNGTDLEKFSPGQADMALKEQLGLQDKFVVSYIGTIGLSQGLAVLVEVAKSLEREYADIHFLVIGDGAQRDKLLAMRDEMGLQNMTFLPPQPRSIVPDLYRLSDITVVALRDVPLFKSTIPSKIFEIMSCGTPMILAVDGEARRIVSEAGGGICISPEDSAAMAEAISRLYNEPTLLSQVAVHGRAYVRAHYDRELLAQQYKDILQDVVSEAKK